MKTIIYCLCVLGLGVAPVFSNAQDGKNPWAVSLSLGYGHDFEQLSPGAVFPLPLVIVTPLGESEAGLGAPWSAQLGLHIPFGKSWGMETGLGASSRSIFYQGLFSDPSEDQCLDCRAGIRLRMYRLPLLLDWIPWRGAEDSWQLHLKAGASFDWSGVIDDIFYQDGSYTLETPSKVEVFDLYEGQSFMFLITDDDLSIGLLGGLEWAYKLGKPGYLGLGLRFSHQLRSPTSLLLWGYDRELDNRVEGYLPQNLQFTTLTAYVRYSFAW